MIEKSTLPNMISRMEGIAPGDNKYLGELARISHEIEGSILELSLSSGVDKQDERVEKLDSIKEEIAKEIKSVMFPNQ